MIDKKLIFGQTGMTSNNNSSFEVYPDFLPVWPESQDVLTRNQLAFSIFYNSLQKLFMLDLYVR